jgi:pyrroline-5-carboxylate reductase
MVSSLAGNGLVVQEAVGGEVKLIRVMPNTPCLVGETASAMCLGGSATEDDAEIVRALFSSVGTIFKVNKFHQCATTVNSLFVLWRRCRASCN